MCFKKILIAVESRPLAEKVVQQGFKIARALNAEVAIVHVITVPQMIGFVDGEYLATDTRDYMEEAGKTMLQELIDEYSEGLNVQQFTPEGYPVNEIIGTRRSWNADLLVMGIHSKGILEKFFLGSTNEDVLAEVKCSVLIVHENDV